MNWTQGPLDAAHRAQVQALADAAAAVDGVAPLSEQFLLDLGAPAGVRHLLHRVGGDLRGYAQLCDHDGHPTAELVVDPTHRRRGLGRELTTAVRTSATGVLVWAHGDLPGARALAAGDGWVAVRDLHVMELGVPSAQGSPDAPRFGAVTLPDDLRVRAFEPGRDESGWLETNAAAFAHHPEQGGMTIADLRAREAQAWFDPAGFLLVVPRDSGSPGPAIAAFHWTKVHPAGDLGPEPVGEVHVVGVHPHHQGRGLAARLTLLGLNHLAAQGLSRIVLWVDGDNDRAVRTYRGLGFTIAATDRMYAHPGD